MTVVVPADAVAVPALLRQIVALDGPAYFRMGRNPAPVIYDPAQEFTLGRAITVREGGDVTIIAMGVMVSLALDAADELARDGHPGARARHAHGQAAGRRGGAAARPRRPARSSPPRITASSAGWAARWPSTWPSTCPCPLARVGIPDTFCRSGDPAELFPMYGMAVPDIVAAVKRVLAKRDTATRGRGEGVTNGRMI